MIPITIADVTAKQIVWNGYVHALPQAGGVMLVSFWPEEDAEQNTEPTVKTYKVINVVTQIDNRFRQSAGAIQLNCVEVDELGRPKQSSIVTASNIIPG